MVNGVGKEMTLHQSLLRAIVNVFHNYHSTTPTAQVK